jgi:hypothetical protein
MTLIYPVVVAQNNIELPVVVAQNNIDLPVVVAQNNIDLPVVVAQNTHSPIVVEGVQTENEKQMLVIHYGKDLQGFVISDQEIGSPNNITGQNNRGRRHARGDRAG